MPARSRRDSCWGVRAERRCCRRNVAPMPPIPRSAARNHRSRVCDFFEVAHDSDRALGVLEERTGLCFALAFAAYAVLREHERVRPVSFAATGVLAGGTMHAEVSGVDGNAAKAAAPIGVAVEAIL